jgi:hypothetical protein
VTNVCSDLSPAEVEEIFNPFWRRDRARTQPGRHAGLGLATPPTVERDGVSSTGSANRCRPGRPVEAASGSAQPGSSAAHGIAARARMW